MCVSVFCSPLWTVNRAGRSPENTREHIPPGGKGHGLYQQLGPVQRLPCLLSVSPLTLVLMLEKQHGTG